MRAYTDPLTGDTLSFGEHMAWKAQGLFRRWSTMALIQVVCVVWLALGDQNARNWWNYSWSDLAIIVENVTMLALFSQTRRDAVVMRETREIARRQTDADCQRDDLLTKVHALTARHDEADRKRDAMLAHLEALLDHHGVNRD